MCNAVVLAHLEDLKVSRAVFIFAGYDASNTEDKFAVAGLNASMQWGTFDDDIPVVLVTSSRNALLYASVVAPNTYLYELEANNSMQARLVVLIRLIALDSVQSAIFADWNSVIMDDKQRLINVNKNAFNTLALDAVNVDSSELYLQFEATFRNNNIAVLGVASTMERQIAALCNVLTTYRPSYFWAIDVMAMRLAQVSFKPNIELNVYATALYLERRLQQFGLSVDTTENFMEDLVGTPTRFSAKDIYAFTAYKRGAPICVN